MSTRINVNNKLQKSLSKIHITSLHIENDLLTLLNLHKTYTIKSINKSKINNISTYINYSRFENDDVKNAIRYFINTLSKNFNENDLLLFYNNINSLKISKMKIDDGSTVARYYILRNEILFTDINTIYHELFHASTSIYTKNSEICGFWQFNKSLDNGIGNGLNEGYTELLAERFFNTKDLKNDSYQYEKNITEAMERIIGQKKMQTYYINANLKGVINELKNYTSNKEIFTFLNRLDFICENRYKKNISYFKQNKIMEYIRYINEFLIITYIDKLKKDKISKEEFDKNINDYLDLFTINILLGDKVCDVDKLMNYTTSKYQKNKIIKRIYE